VRYSLPAVDGTSQLSYSRIDEVCQPLVNDFEIDPSEVSR